MPEPDLLGIVEVVCGGYHTLARTVGGHVLSWGWDDNGQLGHGSLGMSMYVCMYVCMCSRGDEMIMDSSAMEV